MNKNMKTIKYIVTSLMILVFISCNSNKNNFIVLGTITNANNQTLYLEEVGTGSVFSLDSVVLSSNGKYRFEHEGTSYPMFYRLRINSEYIPFTAESNQNIVINADNSNIFSSYTIDGDNKSNKGIQDIFSHRARTDRSIDSVIYLYRSRRIDVSTARNNVDSLCENFKSYLLENYIYVNPKSATAYYALFQRKGSAVYFSADDPNDEKAFAAVATSYDAFHPDAPYTPFLKDMALKAVAQGRFRRELQNKTMKDELNVTVVDFPEIKGIDQRGDSISLNSLAEKGKVILCFTAYSADWSPTLVDRLRKMKKKDTQLKILDISLDKDSFFYLNASKNLPWSSILDIDARISQKYNVEQLPTLFIIQNGNIKRF